MFLLSVFLSLAFADVYMHNPRGSNDRLDEGNTNRQNAERLYNSQNNAKGGYGINTNTESMYFYEGSWLTIEWTNQHACSNDNADCTLVLQYMCVGSEEGAETLIRDGLTTDQIEIENYKETDPETNKYKYGMHESLEHYHQCEGRDRNKGLYIADRNINGENAQYTRQNNGGTRYGFECQEERDYYPYWHPTPWKDIAVLTNDRDRCSYFQENSQNVMEKGHCFHSNEKAGLEDKYKAYKHNNEADCVGDESGEFVWRVEETDHDISRPDCLKAPWSRDNHLGNGITTSGLAGHMNHYNWSLPTTEPCLDDDSCRCVLRLRYNISTSDFSAFGDRGGYGEFVDHIYNSKEKKDALILQNPTLEVGGKRLVHAVNTNQIARTFQDRSHMFRLRKRPGNVARTTRIINLNVRGKRGNIVQTYPAVEYDFVPTFLVARQWDYAHIQWVGFDDNPNNGGNNGEGTEGTDRTNICQIEDMGKNTCMCDTQTCLEESGIKPMFELASERAKFAWLDAKEEDCDSYEVLRQRHDDNQNEINQDPRNCMVMNNPKLAYFDGGLVPLNRIGSFSFMSSRNNNFSNRGHKASLDVIPVLGTWAIAVVAVGAVLLITGMVTAMLVVNARNNPSSSLNELFARM